MDARHGLAAQVAQTGRARRALDLPRCRNGHGVTVRPAGQLSSLAMRTRRHLSQQMSARSRPTHIPRRYSGYLASPSCFATAPPARSSADSQVRSVDPVRNSDRLPPSTHKREPTIDKRNVNVGEATRNTRRPHHASCKPTSRRKNEHERDRQNRRPTHAPLREIQREIRS